MSKFGRKASTRVSFSSAYEYTNTGGYSYSLAEATEQGNPSYRVYISLKVHDQRPGSVQILLQKRVIIAVGEAFDDFKEDLKNQLSIDKYGNGEIWIESLMVWEEIKDHLGMLCPKIEEGWKRMKKEKSREELANAEDDSQNSPEEVE